MKPIRPLSNGIQIVSYAKINIGLRIVCKREDGYHEIETCFKIVSLHDIVSVHKSDVLKLSSNRVEFPLNENNICHKGIRLLEKKVGKPLPVSIDVQKRIPIGAGLGGGSSNGAAVLVGCNKLWDLKLPDHELMELGAGLGSDVPFFVGFLLEKGNTAIGKGRGEILEFFDWNLSEKLLLVYPNIAVSTAWAYQNYKTPLELKKQSFGLTNKPKSIMFSALLDKPLFFDNDFEPAVFAEHSKIKVLWESLESENPKISRMSGSGSTVFAIFEKERKIEGLRDKFPDCVVEVCLFV